MCATDTQFHEAQIDFIFYENKLFFTQYYYEITKHVHVQFIKRRSKLSLNLRMPVSFKRTESADSRAY